MRFGVLGPLAVQTDQGVAVAIPGAKVRALLADLLAHAGEPVSVDRLVDDLWGESAPRNPAGALQAKVSQLRRALDEAEPGARELVVSRPPGYLLDIAPDALDARRFAALVAAARSETEPKATARLLTDALALWRGPAFAEFADEPFARASIDQLSEQRLAVLEDQVAARLAVGEHAELAGELPELIAAHPLRERLYAVHMHALYRGGRQADALETYERLRSRLADELGLDPSPELVRLRQAILEQDPALAPEPAPRTGRTRPMTNLPVPITELVGRDAAVDEVRGLLGTHRLVTLTGPGGVGKTSLGCESARRLIESFPDGVWLVELAGFTPPPDALDALADLVSAILGIGDDATGVVLPEGGRAGSVGRLTGALHEQRMLLVLDNCEHLGEPVAELTGLLLRSAPGLRVLATSREPLGISGEQLWPVPPLALPESGAEEADTEHLRRSSAVALFVARAAAASPGFTLDRDNGHAVAEICRQLDGLPLALELAATRVRALGVHDLALRLRDRFRLLVTGPRTAPARQQTLRAMIDWSWELLSPPERAVLRRIAVHPEGCDLVAAEVVCAGDRVEPADVLDVLARLVDRSLVVAADGPEGTRYRLLETVSAYGQERLEEAGEAEPVRLRHARYFTELAERGHERLLGPEQRIWLRRLDREAANLRAALATAVRQADAELALRLVNALAWYWFLRGKHLEGHRALGMALAVDGPAPDDLRAGALAWQTAIGFLQGTEPAPMDRSRTVLELCARLGDPRTLAQVQWLFGFVGRSGALAASEDLVNAALASFRRLGDDWGLAAALSTRAEQALVRGELAEVERDGAEAAELFAELGDRWGQVRTASILGTVAEIGGDYDRATRLHRDGLRMAEELGLWTVASQELSRLGRLALLAGDYPGAEDLHQRALRLAREHSYEPGASFARGGLGLGARREGRLDLAEKHLRECLDWECRIGYHTGIALTLAELGFIAEQRGDADRALALHRDGLAQARATGDPRAIALALEGIAGAQALAGAHRRAGYLLGAATSARESTGFPQPAAERGDVDRITGAVRAALGATGFEAEFARGRSAGLAEALAAVDAWWPEARRDG
ncbi:BTAD domain-containing putative transcriptional regulator [Amycolatopsis anabasis]|uniref:BTAD domain-containing putative transcriptional regulator n=1 Tax=Amycolatopsis anabasis TaxID=1840409 RepID=UPI00131A862C|nr:BTAD domain-containing putative transcriptional regulator [Amycolatopsis anabasis]